MMQCHDTRLHTVFRQYLLVKRRDIKRDGIFAVSSANQCITFLHEKFLRYSRARCTSSGVSMHRLSVSVSATLIRYPCSSQDRKSTRLNSSHVKISYAVFCL